MKNKIINKIKIILGCIGTIGGAFSIPLSFLFQNPLLLLPCLLIVPSLVFTNNALTNNYVSNSIFGVHRNILHPKEEGNGEQEKVDLICQKYISHAPFEMKMLNSDDVVKSEINKREKEFKQLLESNNIKGEEREKLIEEFKNKNGDMMKSYKFAMNNLISVYYESQMLNIFSQLKKTDEEGNDITYLLCSHGVTINYLESTCADGKDETDKKYFVKNITKGNPIDHDINQLKFLMGNFSFKQLIKKKRAKRKVKMYDVTFQLTGEKLTIEDLPNLIKKEELNCFDVVNKNGSVILKLNKNKVEAYQENILKKIMTNSVQGTGVSVLNNIPLNDYGNSKNEDIVDNNDINFIRKRALLYELKKMMSEASEELNNSNSVGLKK